MQQLLGFHISNFSLCVYFRLRIYVCSHQILRSTGYCRVLLAATGQYKVNHRQKKQLVSSFWIHGHSCSSRTSESTWRGPPPRTALISLTSFVGLHIVVLLMKRSHLNQRQSRDGPRECKPRFRLRCDATSERYALSSLPSFLIDRPRWFQTQAGMVFVPAAESIAFEFPRNLFILTGLEKGISNSW